MDEKTLGEDAFVPCARRCQRVVYDATYYPEGVPPDVNSQECRPYYDHIDIAEPYKGSRRI